jgi:hypothetical protein
LGCSFQLTLAQISVSKPKVVFPKTMYGDSLVVTVDVSNQTNKIVDFKAKIHHPDFYLNDTAFVLSPSAKKTLTVTFKPKHNITYNTELIVSSNSRYGSLRVDIQGDGAYSSYYSSTFNLFEEDLKNELRSIISKNYVNLGYNGARDRMYATIDNVGGKVTCVYTGRSATFNTRSGANNNSFNCEHTWPQSLFNKQEPERADIHHLFPTDVNANSRRGSYAFGLVSSSSWSEGGSKQGGSLFEPRDDHKGDVARAMLYFATRYQNYSGFLTSQESILRSWAMSKPPTQKSIDRNNAIFAVQKNRNPFVDYPEFLSRIASVSTTSAAAKTFSVETSVEEILLKDVPNTFTYTLYITNTGNQPITFHSISKSSAKINVVGSLPVLNPGESASLEIAFDQIGVNFSDELVLKSNEITKNVPITANPTVGLKPVPTIHPTVYVNSTHLVLRKTGPGNLSVYDMSGRKVFFNEILSPFTEIDRTKFLPGTYFVQIIAHNGARSVHRVVIP